MSQPCDILTSKSDVYFVFSRTCEKCERSFASEAGLRDHIALLKGKPCGLYDLLKRRTKQKKFFAQRREAMKEVNKTDLTPEDFKDIPKRKIGPLTTKDKEDIIENIRREITEKGRKQSKAIKETAAKYFRTISMVRSVVREFKACGDVIGGPYYRFRLSTFEKFDLAAKDALRGLVHDQMRDCKEKKEGARYPTVDSIHTAFHEYSNAHPELPKWGRSTTYSVDSIKRTVHLTFHGLFFLLKVLFFFKIENSTFNGDSTKFICLEISNVQRLSTYFSMFLNSRSLY